MLKVLHCNLSSLFWFPSSFAFVHCAFGYHCLPLPLSLLSWNAYFDTPILPSSCLGHIQCLLVSSFFHTPAYTLLPDTTRLHLTFFVLFISFLRTNLIPAKLREAISTRRLGRFRNERLLSTPNNILISPFPSCSPQPHRSHSPYPPCTTKGGC